ncbi:MAG: DegV family protein [Dehalococcoidia bacterium]|nr:DegV family protein [Dehalococcoidia bacterium]
MVKIVTDSSSDIPTEVARELDISIIPLSVRFGDKNYKEGVDINTDEFYHELIHNPNQPKTSTPSPGDFVQLYEHLATETDGIVSIHLSLKYSATCDVARLSSGYVKDKCRVEVIDSQSASMGLGLIAITAAKAAKNGAGLDDIAELIHKAIPRTHLFAIIADLGYALRGKRLGVPGIWLLLGKLGNELHAKLLCEIRDGKINPVGVFRNENKAFDKLEHKMKASGVKDIATCYSTPPDWKEEFTRRMGQIVTQGKLYATRFGCMTGIQSGPKAVGLAFIEGDK